MSLVNKFGDLFKKLLPSPFTIAILLTLFTLILALFLTKPAEANYGEYLLKLAGDWEKGLWNNSGGGLYFAFQMMLMLVLGHILALSAPFSLLIEKLTKPCTNTANTAFIVTLSTLLVSLFNWGLGLIFGAILARKIGEKFSKTKQPLNYGLIGAAAYSGLMVWHGGFSGSAPLKASEPGNLMTLVNGIENIDVTALPNRIPTEETLFSWMNILVTFMLLILLPLLLYLVGKRTKEKVPHVGSALQKEIQEESIEGAERLDYSRVFPLAVGGTILLYAFYVAFILPETFSLKFLNPNWINLTLLGLILVAHKNIASLLKAGDKAVVGAFGILLQFPFYFAIMGIMVGSGLITMISDFMAANSNVFTFPIQTFFSAGFVNIFVPSGGGQWAVQGPIIIAAAQDLNVPLPKAIMALAYGDQLTNMLQPFWALPLLGITGLKAKEILPYTLILFLAGLVIFLLGLVIF